MEYRYLDIECPKCHKKHFRVKQHNTDFGYDILPAVFTRTADPIYKDGILQNPEPVKPAIERFQCMECGCNFRTETYPAKGDVAVFPNIINEDEEENFFEKIIREHNEEAKKQQEKATKITGVKKGGTKVEDITGTANLEIGQGILTYKSEGPTIGLISADDCIGHKLDYSEIEKIYKRIDEMDERFNKIENLLERYL